MGAIVAHILLVALWVGITADASTANVVVGAVVGYLLLAWRGPGRDIRRYVRKYPALVSFVVFYTVEMVLSTLRVAYDVIAPRPRRKPAFVAVPLDARRPEEITLLANLITLTPGTLAADLADDGTTLWIHAMFVDDVDQFRHRIKNDYERRVRELLA